MITTTNPKSLETELFRNKRSQLLRIPAEFELPADHVLIHREGTKLIIEPATGPASIVELLTQWRKDEPLATQDQLPLISDVPIVPQDRPIRRAYGFEPYDD